MNTSRFVTKHNRIELSKDQITANMRALLAYDPAVAVAPVLKSNAYGHGLSLIGPVLDTFDVPFFCVNSIYEAHTLRDAGVKSDILIMGYVDPKDLTEDVDYIFAVFDAEYAQMISSNQTVARIHINVETGLHRDGIHEEDFTSVLNQIKKLSNLKVEGLMSHLACSNDPECPTTVNQLANFKKAKEIVAAADLQPTWYHLGGSLALLNHLSADCNVVRCGKAIFGVGLNSSYVAASSSPTPNNLQELFKPVLTLKTKIAQVKKIKKGDHVSYSDSFIAGKDMKIAVLPIGYNDGVERRLANTGVVTIDGVNCQMLGVVAMNVNVIDVSEVPNPHMGQDVVVYSSNPADQNSLDRAALMCGTLPQDFLLHLPSGLSRELI